MASIQRADTAAVEDSLLSDPLQFRLPDGAPVFLCPSCQCRLHYVGSRPAVDGERALDLLDRYTCPAGCGAYEYVRQTHRLRDVGP